MAPVDFRDKSSHIPIAREGVPFILAAAFVTLVAAVLGQAFPAWLFMIVTLFIGHFFRDPQRVSNAGPLEVLSPADGKVIAIKRVERNRFLDRPCMKISIFMSVFDVHVNRIPVSGSVQGMYYQKGSYLAANRDQAGVENEQNWIWIHSASGHDVILTQVAGLIARRIVCWPVTGDQVVQGERFGLIRFGSRVDVYVPEHSDILVSMGRVVQAGETTLCRMK